MKEHVEIGKKIKGELDYLVVKLCENLPLGATLFEEEGLCYKPTEHCKYCRKISENTSSCNKKNISQERINNLLNFPLINPFNSLTYS